MYTHITESGRAVRTHAYLIVVSESGRPIYAEAYEAKEDVTERYADFTQPSRSMGLGEDVTAVLLTGCLDGAELPFYSEDYTPDPERPTVVQGQIAGSMWSGVNKEQVLAICEAINNLIEAGHVAPTKK